MAQQFRPSLRPAHPTFSLLWFLGDMCQFFSMNNNISVIIEMRKNRASISFFVFFLLFSYRIFKNYPTTQPLKKMAAKIKALVELSPYHYPYSTNEQKYDA